MYSAVSPESIRLAARDTLENGCTELEKIIGNQRRNCTAPRINTVHEEELS